MGKTSKELEEKLAELQAASVEAGVEFKRIDEQIEQAKLDFGMQVLEGKKADKSKLNELAEKRDELGMRLNALAKKIGDTQAELAEAKAVERTVAVETSRVCAICPGVIICGPIVSESNKRSIIGLCRQGACQSLDQDQCERTR